MTLQFTVPFTTKGEFFSNKLLGNSIVIVQTSSIKKIINSNFLRTFPKSSTEYLLVLFAVFQCY